MKCKFCGKETDGTFCKGKFCSNFCLGKYSYSRQDKDEWNKHLANIRKKIPHGRWKCKFCNKILNSRKLLKKHIKEIHGITYLPGGSWLKGRTKYNEPAIKKRVLIYKKHFKEGLIKINFKGKHHTKEAREKISKARIRNLETNERASSWRQDVKCYKIKNINGEEFLCRGHWEENVANKLNERKILWIRRVEITYNDDGIEKIYNPDFYLPKYNKFIEVKGYYPEKDKRKMNLVIEQNPEAKIYFLLKERYLRFLKTGKFRKSWIFKLGE